MQFPPPFLTLLTQMSISETAHALVATDQRVRILSGPKFGSEPLLTAVMNDPDLDCPVYTKLKTGEVPVPVHSDRN